VETSDQAQINYHPEHIHGDGGYSNTIPGLKQYLPVTSVNSTTTEEHNILAI
jgi:hypothetical protein